MASIRTSISVQDGLSQAFQRMTQSIQQTTAEFEEIQNLVRQGINSNGINQAAQAQNNLNNNMNQGASIADTLTKRLLGIGAALGAAFSVKGILAASDAYTQTAGRLRLVDDGLRSIDELQQQIFESAQRTGTAYGQVANSVAGFRQRAGATFKTNDEAIVFAELLNKSFGIANATQQEAASATLQLTQALGSGALRGEELNAVLEAAPNIVQLIADELGVTFGEIRGLASEGVITADVIKNAIIGAGDDINASYESLPFTSGAIWTRVKNDALFAFSGILTGINGFLNSQEFTGFLDGVSNSLYTLSAIATPIFNAIATAAQFIYDNWAFIAPIFITVGLALTGLALQWTLVTGATFLATNAVRLFNAALAASPLVIVILILSVLIGLFYAAVEVYNYFTNSSISATELLVGALFAAGAIITNIFIGLATIAYEVFKAIYNIVASVAEFFANVFRDPLKAAARLFFDFADAVLGVINSLSKAIDKVFGTSLADGLSATRKTLNNFVDSEFGANAIQIKRFADDDFDIKRLDVGNAFSYGKTVGGNLTAPKIDTKPDKGIQSLLDSLQEGNGIMEGVKEDTGKTAQNTAITSEDLKYLRDAANTEALNRFGGVSINVQMDNNNTINSALDLDGIVDSLAIAVEEALYTTAEGI